MISILEFIADHVGTVIIWLFAVLMGLAIVRIIVKWIRREKIEITPVGIMNDLPDSVTGMNKYSDALLDDDQKDESY